MDNHGGNLGDDHRDLPLLRYVGTRERRWCEREGGDGVKGREEKVMRN